MKCEICGCEKSYTINGKCPICDNEELQKSLKENEAIDDYVRCTLEDIKLGNK
jgi:hypothetical protein